MGVRGLAPAITRLGVGLGSGLGSGLDRETSDGIKGGVSFFPRCLVLEI